jgi:hypothetical protein
MNFVARGVGLLHKCCAQGGDPQTTRRRLTLENFAGRVRKPDSAPVTVGPQWLAFDLKVKHRDVVAT